MKRWMALVALALLLTGCASTPAPTETTVPAGSTTATTVPTAPSEPIPEPEAIEVENLTREYEALVPAGDNLLLIGADFLSLYTPNGVAATAAVAIPNPDSGNLRITEDRIVYYDAADNALVTLDLGLKELQREALQEPVLGSPWISADGKSIYYCTADGIRLFEAEHRISRNLKVHAGDWLGISGSLFDHGALIVRLQQTDGQERILLVDTATGETTFEGSQLANITGSGNFYCCITKDEWIFGDADDQPQNFLIEEAAALPEGRLAYTTAADEMGFELALYDLNTGRHIAKAHFDITDAVTGPVFWQDRLVLLSGSRLYFWDWTRSGVEDETVYSAYRYTADDPDTEGLAALQERFDALGKAHGIDILLWKDVTGVQPEGYTFEIEHRTRIYEEALAALETALDQFPAGFLKTAASWTEDGKIHLVLTRGITSPGDECGGQYLLGWKAYIPLTLDDSLTQSLYHGLGHIIDTLVLSQSSAFYEWHNVNPDGFAYDNDFDSWQGRESSYLKGDNRYFVNSFAMTFPVEDRASLFEYAMMEGNQEIFASKPMQTKLKRLKTGLRKSFDLEDDGYLWEQYLK